MLLTLSTFNIHPRHEKKNDYVIGYNQHMITIAEERLDLTSTRVKP